MARNLSSQNNYEQFDSDVDRIYRSVAPSVESTNIFNHQIIQGKGSDFMKANELELLSPREINEQLYPVEPKLKHRTKKEKRLHTFICSIALWPDENQELNTAP